MAYAPLIFDLHGVLLGRREPAGHQPAGEVLRQLRAAGHPLRFLTNSSSVGRQQVAKQLASAGVEVDAGEVYTAAMTVAHYLRRCGRPRKLFVVGSDALRAELDAICGGLLSWAAPEEADTVVASRDPALDEETLRRLARAAQPQLIATCRDLGFPDGDGIHPGPGQTVARVEQALDAQALVLGKPNPYALASVMDLPAPLSDCVVIGDSPLQDVALARNAGAKAVLVASGGDAPGGPEPDWRIDAIDQLLPLLCR
ncbi:MULTISPECIES: HAD-IIA family hydrolase [Chromobacteriaceae]|uniref:HAD hydrolase-like protein n=2 Tax=Chromobacteriaceae TaxID=1499392 RepID=A0ABV0CLX2_9NEIS|nr:HAD hydrolase-like protein [Pseudogulbenkiania ferrooxidans]ERE04133.1 hypothetical protein O166_12040 [Pseudogulbenkiania ferrooxidans EGD-HP2]